MKERPILMNSTSVQAILAGRKVQTRRVIRPQPKKTQFAWAYWASSRAIYARAQWGTEVAMRKQLPKHCPHGISGDRLWCRETWAITYEEWEHYNTDLGPEANAFLTVWTGKKPTLETLKKLDMGGLTYRADYPDREGPLTCDMVWRSSIHMPRWASRILLEITDVRVERVQDISEEDARAEGVGPLFSHNEIHRPRYRAELDLDPMPYQNYLWHGYIGTEITNKQAEAWKHQFSSYETAHGSFSSLWEKINAKRGYGWEANPWCWVLEFKVIEPELKGMNQ